MTSMHSHMPDTPGSLLYEPLRTVLGDQLVKVGTLARRWQASPTHLGTLRRRGKGPAWVQLYPDGPFRYRWRDVLAYEVAGQGGHLTLDRIALAISVCPDVDPGALVKVIQHLHAAFPSRAAPTGQPTPAQPPADFKVPKEPRRGRPSKRR